MAKIKKPKVTGKKSVIDYAEPVTVSMGGHRDLAEKLSQDYFHFTRKLKWEQMQELLNMDQLTAMLQQVDDHTLEETMKDPWSQGFLMGMLHQLSLVHLMAIDSEEEDGEGN